MVTREVLDHLFVTRVGSYSSAVPIIFRQSGFDIGLGGHAQVNLRAQQMGETVDGVEVGGIRQGDSEIAIVLKDGYDAILSGDVAWNGGNHLIGYLHLPQIYNLRAEMRRL